VVKLIDSGFQADKPPDCRGCICLFKPYLLPLDQLIFFGI